MKQFGLHLLVVLVWPLVAVFTLVMLASFFVLIWPGLLLVPVRLENGEIKVGDRK